MSRSASKSAQAQHDASSAGRSRERSDAPQLTSHTPDPGRPLGNWATSRLIEGGGAPLAPMLRAEMERRFGESFAEVRVHDDASAHARAEGLDANAYTLGNRVVFNAGRFEPHSVSGKRLLAHELAHVVQQRRGGAVPSPAGEPALEAQAHAAAGRVAAGLPAQVAGASAPGVMRDDSDRRKRKREKFPLKRQDPDEDAEFGADPDAAHAQRKADKKQSQTRERERKIAGKSDRQIAADEADQELNRLEKQAQAPGANRQSQQRKERRLKKFQRKLPAARGSQLEKNQRSGDLDEAQRTPSGAQTQGQYVAGGPRLPDQDLVDARGRAVSHARPDYSVYRRNKDGSLERVHINLKSHAVDQMTEGEARAAAREILYQAVRNQAHLPPGEKLIIDFGHVPSPAIQEAIKNELFRAGADTPISEIRFGTIVHRERDYHPQGGRQPLDTDAQARRERLDNEKKAAQKRQKADEARAKKLDAQFKTSQRRKEKEAAKKKKREDAAAARQKKKEEAAAARQKKKDEATAARQKKKDESAAARQKKRDEDAAARQKKKDEAAAAKQKKKDDAAAATKKQQDERAAAKKKPGNAAPAKKTRARVPAKTAETGVAPKRTETRSKGRKTTAAAPGKVESKTPAKKADTKTRAKKTQTKGTPPTDKDDDKPTSRKSTAKPRARKTEAKTSPTKTEAKTPAAKTETKTPAKKSDAKKSTRKSDAKPRAKKTTGKTQGKKPDRKTPARKVDTPPAKKPARKEDVSPAPPKQSKTKVLPPKVPPRRDTKPKTEQKQEAPQESPQEQPRKAPPAKSKGKGAPAGKSKLAVKVTSKSFHQDQVQVTVEEFVGEDKPFRVTTTFMLKVGGEIAVQAQNQRGSASAGGNIGATGTITVASSKLMTEAEKDQYLADVAQGRGGASRELTIVELIAKGRSQDAVKALQQAQKALRGGPLTGDVGDVQELGVEGDVTAGANVGGQGNQGKGASFGGNVQFSRGKGVRYTGTRLADGRELYTVYVTDRSSQNLGISGGYNVVSGGYNDARSEADVRYRSFVLDPSAADYAQRKSEILGSTSLDQLNDIAAKHPDLAYGQGRNKDKSKTGTTSVGIFGFGIELDRGEIDEEGESEDPSGGKVVTMRGGSSGGGSFTLPGGRRVNPSSKTDTFGARITEDNKATGYAQSEDRSVDWSKTSKNLGQSFSDAPFAAAYGIFTGSKEVLKDKVDTKGVDLPDDAFEIIANTAERKSDWDKLYSGEGVSRGSAEEWEETRIAIKNANHDRTKIAAALKKWEQGDTGRSKDVARLAGDAGIAFDFPDAIATERDVYDQLVFDNPIPAALEAGDAAAVHERLDRIYNRLGELEKNLSNHATEIEPKTFVEMRQRIGARRKQIRLELYKLDAPPPAAKDTTSPIAAAGKVAGKVGKSAGDKKEEAADVKKEEAPAPDADAAAEQRKKEFEAQERKNDITEITGHLADYKKTEASVFANMEKELDSFWGPDVTVLINEENRIRFSYKKWNEEVKKLRQLLKDSGGDESTVDQYAPNTKRYLELDRKIPFHGYGSGLPGFEATE